MIVLNASSATDQIKLSINIIIGWYLFFPFGLDVEVSSSNFAIFRALLVAIDQLLFPYFDVYELCQYALNNFLPKK